MDTRVKGFVWGGAIVAAAQVMAHYNLSDTVAMMVTFALIAGAIAHMRLGCSNGCSGRGASRREGAA